MASCASLTCSLIAWSCSWDIIASPRVCSNPSGFLPTSLARLLHDLSPTCTRRRHALSGFWFIFPTVSWPCSSSRSSSFFASPSLCTCWNPKVRTRSLSQSHWTAWSILNGFRGPLFFIGNRRFLWLKGVGTHVFQGQVGLLGLSPERTSRWWHRRRPSPGIPHGLGTERWAYNPRKWGSKAHLFLLTQMPIKAHIGRMYWIYTGTLLDFCTLSCKEDSETGGQYVAKASRKCPNNQFIIVVSKSFK